LRRKRELYENGMVSKKEWIPREREKQYSRMSEQQLDEEINFNDLRLYSHTHTHTEFISSLKLKEI
jgi:hypothetical protein